MKDALKDGNERIMVFYALQLCTCARKHIACTALAQIKKSRKFSQTSSTKYMALATILCPRTKIKTGDCNHFLTAMPGVHALMRYLAAGSGSAGHDSKQKA
ncbi:hypothetical protein ACO0LF_22760 [Undibacterium sp. Di27W]|uniref:hypothetical protein n=1 Tax=Undibacterium sp. Di27W TaxID=3413036 RepID=UPI003BF4023B